MVFVRLVRRVRRLDLAVLRLLRVPVIPARKFVQPVTRQQRHRRANIKEERLTFGETVVAAEPPRFMHNMVRVCTRTVLITKE